MNAIDRALGSGAASLLTLVLVAVPAAGQVPPATVAARPAAAAEPTPIPIGTTTVELPEPRHTSGTSLEEALIGRMATQQFAAAPVTRAEVSQLLWAAQGITEKKSGRRAAPSAGGLFPLEVILVAANVTGLPPAVYRYRPATNDLVRIAEGDRRPAIAEACHFPPLADAPAIFVFTGVLARTAKAYGSQAPKLIAIEAGAATQDLSLEATALDLGCAMLVGFELPKLQSAIAVESGEIPFAVLAVTRPEPQAAH